VTKFNPAGSGLVYSSFLSGSTGLASGGHRDEALAIAVDAAGNAYVTGIAGSSDFPTTPDAIQPQRPTTSPSWTAFVTALNSAGSALVYSTYLSGGSDSGQGIAVDKAGNAYVTGYTDSTTFPTTPGAFQTAQRGFRNGFVTKFSDSRRRNNPESGGPNANKQTAPLAHSLLRCERENQPDNRRWKPRGRKF